MDVKEAEKEAEKKRSLRNEKLKVAGMKSTHTFCAALKLTILWFCVQVVYITEPLIKIH